jgi:hypothetical protein
MLKGGIKMKKNKKIFFAILILFLLLILVLVAAVTIREFNRRNALNAARRDTTRLAESLNTYNSAIREGHIYTFDELYARVGDSMIDIYVPQDCCPFDLSIFYDNDERVYEIIGFLHREEESEWNGRMTARWSVNEAAINAAY